MEKLFEMMMLIKVIVGGVELKKILFFASFRK